MNNLIESAQHIHLTGFKGVAMASIAQCLHDMGKTLSGSDVPENFVTDKILTQTNIKEKISFDGKNIPPETELLIYTAAHQGPENPEVIWAKGKHLPVMSQAEALAELFNQKKGIAVCGVGGKSTTSAMITWIFKELNIPISFSVGVGSISGMTKTGQWDLASEYFVAEADEYVIDPGAAHTYGKIIPRFSFLKPQIIVCTYLAFDHPDVYKDYQQTQQTFLEFFLNLKQNGSLIINGDQSELVQIAQKVKSQRPDISIHTFGENKGNDLHVQQFEYQNSQLTATIFYQDHNQSVLLSVPGKHNLLNAAAAIMASTAVNLPTNQVVAALTSFHSTKRRFEFRGIHRGVTFYDDYAHHPRELKIVIQTLKEMFPDKHIYLAFQPHTFSRTKALLNEFVDALGQAPHLLLTEIFASAREAFDPTITSKLLAEIIQKKYPDSDIKYLASLDDLAQYCFHKLPQDSICMTVGAGDIYQIHDKIVES